MKRILIFMCCAIFLVATLSVSTAALSLAPYSQGGLDFYHSYLEENGVPENFVSYEQLSFVGEFAMFECSTYGAEYYGYHFRLPDNPYWNTIVVQVYADMSELAELDELEKVVPSGVDLREDRYGGLYRHSETLWYQYRSNGALKQIYLIVDGQCFGIEARAERGFLGVTIEKNHIVARLLNQKTASAAYLEFVSQLKGSPITHPLVFSRSTDAGLTADDGCASVVPSGVGLLTLCGAAAVVVTKKKKAKK